ncbi:MAG: GIY-YIG nuclease family protein [Lachnospiraceae bacterium]|nr:GIY-YIG nuclease family protein [Lachnospiraceae bacterium]
MKDTAYTYIVECGDGSLYTGWTKGLKQRIKCHNEGKGAKYTRSRLPVRLVYYEVFATRQEAMKREYAVKQMERKDKLKLLNDMSEKVRQECRRIMDELSQI